MDGFKKSRRDECWIGERYVYFCLFNNDYIVLLYITCCNIVTNMDMSIFMYNNREDRTCVGPL